MQIARGLMIFAVALVTLMGCSTPRTVATETEIEQCRAWKNSLPTRSRQDTQQTQDEIGAAYTAYDAVCAALTGKADP